MKIIGILGGVASGKSLVADQFRRLGAEVLNADQIGHEVLREPEVIEQLRTRWGAGVIDQHGQINRRAVAKIVFAPPPDGPTQLAFLEQITHPRIGARLAAKLKELSQRNDLTAVVLDAPVMLKAGWDKFCDRIVFVDAPVKLRHERACNRGWMEADFAAREDAQETLDKKRKAADVVIDNTSSPEKTFSRVQEIWRSLQ